MYWKPKQLRYFFHPPLAMDVICECPSPPHLISGGRPDRRGRQDLLRPGHRGPRGLGQRQGISQSGMIKMLAAKLSRFEVILIATVEHFLNVP